MTHAHMTKFTKKDFLMYVDRFEKLVESHEVNNFINEDAVTVVFNVLEILRHEIERIVVEER